MLEQFEFPLQPGAAGVEFVEGRFVVGRGTMGGAGDIRAVKFESVVPPHAFGAVGEAGFVEDAVKQVARFVAGEDAAGAIGSVGSGGEADDEQAGVGIAEGRDWSSPVFVGKVGAAPDTGDFGAMLDQARATAAGGDLLLQGSEPCVAI